MVWRACGTAEVSEGPFDAIALLLAHSLGDRCTRRMRRGGMTASMLLSARWFGMGVDIVALVREHGLRAAFAEQQAEFIRQQVKFNRQPPGFRPEALS